MKFRIGLVIGFALGYYFGAKAGRERYHEIEHWLDKVRGTPQYRDVRSRVDDFVDIQRGRTITLLDDVSGGAASTILDLRPGNAPFDADLDEPTA